MNKQATGLLGKEASWTKRTETPLTPMKRPSSKPSSCVPQTEQTRADYSVQDENQAQQTLCPHVQQVQGWWVWDVPVRHRHHDCRTSDTALPVTWCSEAGHVARTKITEGQALWQPGGAKEDCRFCEGNGHLRLAYEEEDAYDHRTTSSLFDFKEPTATDGHSYLTKQMLVFHAPPLFFST